MMTKSRFHKRPLTLLLAALCLAYWLPQITAQTTNRAALVVDYGDGQVQSRCVAFTEEQISGYDLLLRSGLDVAADVQGMGTLICGIGGVGCPASNCLCQCSGGPSCIYWSYWRQVGGSWQFSQAGASMSVVTNGSVEGWSWGVGGVNQAIPPPDFSFAEICLPSPTATATATVIPTATPIPAPQINFSVDVDTLQAGSCTTLRWQTAHIQAVYLNGNGVTGNETQQICPEETQTYTLRVIHATGEETRTVTVTVLPVTQTDTPTPIVLATATPRVGTSLATVSPTAPPPPATAVSEVATVSPTATTATPTPTIIWVTVPALPAETAVAATEVAILPPADETAALPTPAPVVADADGETAVDWLPYTIFLVMLAGLGLLLVYAGRQQ